MVVAPTHCDGSANSALLADGRRLFYTHPDYANYDTNFRLEQVE